MKTDPQQPDLFAWADSRPKAEVYDIRMQRMIRWARARFRGTPPRPPVTKPADVMPWPTEKRIA